MSMGGPTAHPAFMKADVNPATPENISQKHIVLSNRIEAIKDVQDAGQDGRSLENLNALKDPRRVSSTRRISSGFAWGVVTSSAPESSLSECSTQSRSNKDESRGTRSTELKVESAKP